MSNSPADDERLDTDPTDELPILLESEVLGSEEQRASLVVGDDATGEHTIHHQALAAAEDAAEVEELKNDLEQRRAKIAALEQDISRLSTRWGDVERHLTAKDHQIGELNATLASLRSALDGRSAIELRLTADIAERDADLSQAKERLEQYERKSTGHSKALADHKLELQAALDKHARLQEQLAAQAAVISQPNETQALREEIATLSSYIMNRRTWWDELEARAAVQATRISELATEVAHRTERQQRSEAHAARETARAEALREQLVAQSRRAESLDAELGNRRADPLAPLATIARLERQLADALADLADARAQLRDLQNTLTEQSDARALREAEHAAALVAQADARVLREGEHAAALAAADALRVEALAAAAADAARAAEAATLTPRVPLETFSQLQSDLEQARSELAAEHVIVHDQAARLVARAADIEAANRQLAEVRDEADQARHDAARLERSLIDKDRALEARDERIATLQAELDVKLGALQKLNAMDLSLQGLDSKMSERLRRSDAPPVDQPNTPALICLTSDVPRQYALNKKTLTIGRSSRCEIQILTHFVSREHARLTINRGTVVIEDLGSTNGIFVNSVRAERQELRHGDLVTVGETQFRFLESMAH